MVHLSNLKKYYFINQFNPVHLKKLDKNITLIWRSKYKVIDYKIIHKLAIFCKLNRLDLFLANNVKLAIKLNLSGAYISAYNKDYRFNSYKLKKNFKIIGSAHNIFELNIKKTQRINEIFISPIFKKKNIQPYGIHKARHLFNSSDFTKIALGGINKQNVKLLRLGIFNGFAGIKYFE
tara:strand:- start:1234 stop:1767 length:534 start_codon:yes stop_codon:yes gene_type:complete